MLRPYSLVIWPATDGEAERSGDVPAFTHIRWTNRGRPVVWNHFCNLSIPRRSPEGLSSFVFLLRLLPWFPLSHVWEQAICKLWLRKWAIFLVMSMLLIVGVTCDVAAPAFLKTARWRPYAHICSVYCPRINQHPWFRSLLSILGEPRMIRHRPILLLYVWLKACIRDVQNIKVEFSYSMCANRKLLKKSRCVTVLTPGWWSPSFYGSKL